MQGFYHGLNVTFLLYDVRQRIKTNKRPIWATFLTWEPVPCKKKKPQKKTKLRHAQDVRPIRTVARVNVCMVQHASEKGEES